MATTTMTTMRPTTAPATTTMSKADFSTPITTTTCACPSCGLTFTPPPLLDTHSALVQAQRQIAQLQSQVRVLNQKAAAAVDRWADYEDELSRLRAGSTTSSSTATGTTHSDTPRSVTNTNISTASPRSSFLGAGANRLSQLLSPRSSNTSTTTTSVVANNNSSNINKPLPPSGQLSPTTAQTPGSPAWRVSRSPSNIPLDPDVPIGPTNKEVLAALGRERKLREAAEAKVEETSREVEELSVSLFEQANEMVATERRARAKLEERVDVLEKRDSEKKIRLDRLEGAMGRLKSVRAYFAEGEEAKSEPEEKQEKDGGKGEFDVA